MCDSLWLRVIMALIYRGYQNSMGDSSINQTRNSPGPRKDLSPQWRESTQRKPFIAKSTERNFDTTREPSMVLSSPLIPRNLSCEVIQNRFGRLSMFL